MNRSGGLLKPLENAAFGVKADSSMRLRFSAMTGNSNSKRLETINKFAGSPVLDFSASDCCAMIGISQ